MKSWVRTRNERSIQRQASYWEYNERADQPACHFLFWQGWANRAAVLKDRIGRIAPLIPGYHGGTRCSRLHSMQRARKRGGEWRQLRGWSACGLWSIARTRAQLCPYSVPRCTAGDTRWGGGTRPRNANVGDFRNVCGQRASRRRPHYRPRMGRGHCTRWLNLAGGQRFRAQGRLQTASPGCSRALVARAKCSGSAWVLSAKRCRVRGDRT